MRAKLFFLSLLIAVAGLGSMQAYNPQEEDVRGAFLTTRPKASAKTDKSGSSSRPTRRHPKAVKPDPVAVNSPSPAPGKNPGPISTPDATPRKASAQPWASA